MEILVAVLLMHGVRRSARARLSFDRPGKFQHTFELIYEFVRGQAEDQVGHEVPIATWRFSAPFFCSF